MKAVAYGRPDRQAGLAASLRGLAAIGIETQVYDGKPGPDFTPEPCDITIMEGVRSQHRFVYEAHQRPGAPLLIIIEYGYIKRATHPDDQMGLSWQLSPQRLGWVPDYPCGPERFEALGVEIAPLRECEPDAPIIVVGDHPGFADSTGDFLWPDIRHWAVTALEQIRAVTDRRVFWRPHPRQQIGIPGFDGLSIGEIDWSKQWACVVFNSNTGNEALIKGCPVFTDGWAGYRQVSNTDLSQIENPVLPELEDYFHRLAHGQWFIPEIERGEPFLEYIKKGVIR